MNDVKKFRFEVFAAVLILGLAMPSVVLAVKLAPGRVPNLAPLQPIPEGIAPEFSKNLQSGYFAAPSAPAPEAASGGEVLIPAEPKQKPAAGPKSGAANPVSPNSAFFWVFLLPLALLALGWPVYKVWHGKRESRSKSFSGDPPKRRESGIRK